MTPLSSGEPARDAEDRSALANVLGALALVVTDEMTRAVVEASGADRGSATDAAALSALAQFLDGATVDRLHQALGLTPSGAVRLVDRLAADGLVVRQAGEDKRSLSVLLTATGRERALRVRDARSAYLASLLDGLDPDEVDLLRSLLARVATKVVEAKEGGAWTCRLCDVAACRRERGECPTANAARAKYAESAPPPQVPREQW